MTQFGARRPAAPYGSREWLDRAYRRVEGDPWGLDWRPSQVERYHRMIDVVAAQPAAHRARRILDVGCATGTFTAMLAASLGEPGVEIRGMDLAALAISRARVRFPGLGFDCLTLEDAERQFGGTCDVVTLLEVLYYVPEGERAAVLDGIRRLLRPGGILVVSSMVARTPYMSPSELEALVARSLRVIDRGVLTLKPLTIFEKPLLRAANTWSRIRNVRPTAALPKRGRTAATVAWLGHQLLGERAVSHGYVVGIAEGHGRG